MHVAPDCITHENTEKFDYEIFSILCGDRYAVHSCVFSPAHLGLPLSRTRRYSLLVRKDSWQLQVPFEWNVLQPEVTRMVGADAQIFFRAPGSLLRALQHVAEPDPDDEIGQHLSEGDQSRLLEVRAVAVLQSLPFVCVNVKQSLSWQSRPSGLMPALTTKTAVIYGLSLSQGFEKRRVVNRALSGYEHWGVMGWPVLLSATNPLSKYVPKCMQAVHVLQHPERSLSESQMYELSGNMMHSSAVALPVIVAMLAESVNTDALPPPGKRVKCEQET